MTADFSEETATAVVVDSFARTPDDRLRTVLGALVRHLHGFVREVEPTQAEWEAAIGFLTAVGAMCDDKRQEFILLSDVLGVSMLVDAINHRTPAGATESTVLGPFHVVRSPERVLGDDLADVSEGEPLLVRGRVLDLDGAALAGAAVDVWHADAEGFYDVQKDATPDQDLRGLFHTDEDGRFWFRTVEPSHYPIPDDGPVGDLLRRTKRHPYRPAHIHLIVTADGHVPVTTHVFLDGSPYLDDDTVFGVKRSLVRRVRTEHDADGTPYRVVDFDVTLSGDGRRAAGRG
ncbi:MAG: 6-chlorohydroxyquinol-1,2-dioxygenase [Nocardioidaceae bacterium]|nr:6-chlorohydroxyquinol-1,2-dioxygenase [Nocardioidaceae bacterium]NUS50028.1 6-chlorohydroxyquinol-1,2-dioxygenase [Nocardioidaceae bacterium]